MACKDLCPLHRWQNRSPEREGIWCPCHCRHLSWEPVPSLLLALTGQVMQGPPGGAQHLVGTEENWGPSGRHDSGGAGTLGESNGAGKVTFWVSLPHHPVQNPVPSTLPMSLPASFCPVAFRPCNILLPYIPHTLCIACSLWWQGVSIVCFSAEPPAQNIACLQDSWVGEGLKT